MWSLSLLIYPFPFCLLLLLAVVSAQAEVPVHIHRTQQLGAVCKVSLGSPIAPSSTHQSPKQLSPFPSRQSHSTSQHLLLSVAFLSLYPSKCALNICSALHICMCYLSCLTPPSLTPPQVLPRRSAGGIGWRRQGCQAVGQANEGMCTHIL